MKIELKVQQRKYKSNEMISTHESRKLAFLLLKKWNQFTSILYIIEETQRFTHSHHNGYISLTFHGRNTNGSTLAKDLCIFTYNK